MASTASSPESRPQALSRQSSRSSRMSLTLDLSSLPPLQLPTPATNTLLITNLQDLSIFRPDNLETIKDLILKTAPIHTWAPLKSFRRILVSFYSEADAIAVRSVWDGEAVMGERCRVYFGTPTPLDVSPNTHLALPDAGKLFFISPPPSPPHDWEQRVEGAPNKEVHAEDLAEALARLHHTKNVADSPVSPVEGKSPGGFGPSPRQARSRSSTLIFHPENHGSSPNLPCVMVDDMTDGPEDADSTMDDEPKATMAHTSRPPVELMNDA
ncbi:Calcipressin-2 [Cytospora mali]|uniref:Calcipressin-2 n=1 Tax=Cytospora mali TaxID=578113 RepID=A0A194WCW4_CYTMA|nr:Calcipressin-2 [Valsa mali]